MAADNQATQRWWNRWNRVARVGHFWDSAGGSICQARSMRVAEALAPLRRQLGCHDAALCRQAALRLLPSRNTALRQFSSSATRPWQARRQLPTAAHRNASLFSTKHLRVAQARLTLSEKPDDPAALKSLYEVLLEDGTRTAQTTEEVITSYESKSGLFAADADASNAILADKSLYDLYLRALVQTSGGADKVLVAQERRTAALAGTAAPIETQASSSSAASAEPTLTTEQLTAAALSKEFGDRAKTRIADSAPKYAGAGAAGAAAGASAAKGEPIRIVVSHEKEALWLRALRPILSALIWTLVILTVFSFVLDQGPGGIMKAAAGAGPSEFKPSPGTEPVKFSDVHGCEEAKAELQEVVEFLKDPTKFSKLGGKLTRGVLLTGPPGTGKTLLARAVAGEAGVSFFIASGSDFDEMFVGVGAKRIRELFSAARKGAPAIIFIDELDAVGGKRSPRDMQHVKQTLNQLLVEMDGFSQGSGIVVIGATNLPETLDKALVRPGRFDRHIAVPLPDVRGRLAILKHHAQKNKVPYDEKLVDMGTIARGTPGFSGAELQALINQAAVRASLDNSERVLPQHFEWAKDRIMLGSERKSAVITPESRQKTAWHEAGHAILALFTPHADPLHKITVIPRGHALGITFQLPEMDRDSMSFAEFKAKLDVYMGGRAAEELIYGRENVTSGAASDIQGATKIATAMVRQFGFSDAVGPVSLPEEEAGRQSTETRAVIEREIRSIIESAAARAEEMLRSKKTEFERLANALVKYETLTGAEARQVINGEPLNRPVV